MTTSLPVDRIAGAPISWGLCEVPGWGYQLTPQRVLSEMQGLGLVATEFGPPGFLEAEAESRVAQLAAYGLSAVGGFHVAVLHDPGHDPVPGVDAFIDECLAAKAGMVVLAAGTGQAGYDARPELDETGWQTLLTNLDRIADHAASRGVEASLHPHMGTMIESGAETLRVIEGSHIGLCVDTGHLAAAGSDPGAIVAVEPGPGPPRAPQGRRQRAGRTGGGRLAHLRRRRPRRALRAARQRLRGRHRDRGQSWRERATRAGTSSSRT